MVNEVSKYSPDLTEREMLKDQIKKNQNADLVDIFKDAEDDFYPVQLKEATRQLIKDPDVYMAAKTGYPQRVRETIWLKLESVFKPIGWPNREGNPNNDAEPRGRPFDNSHDYNKQRDYLRNNQRDYLKEIEKEDKYYWPGGGPDSYVSPIDHGKEGNWDDL